MAVLAARPRTRESALNSPDRTELAATHPGHRPLNLEVQLTRSMLAFVSSVPAMWDARKKRRNTCRNATASANEDDAPRTPDHLNADRDPLHPEVRGHPLEDGRSPSGPPSTQGSAGRAVSSRSLGVVAPAYIRLPASSLSGTPKCASAIARKTSL